MVPAAVTLFLAATLLQPPSPRLLPLIAAALRSGPQSVSPSPAAVQRILGRDLFAPPNRHSAADAEWLRYESKDGTCIVELGPIIKRKVAKFLAGCRFATRNDAIRFLHEMVIATGADWRPPMTYPPDSEIRHIAIVLLGRSPLSAEAHLYEERGGQWRAMIVLAVGGRSVVLPPGRR